MAKQRGSSIERNNLRCPLCEAVGVESGTTVSYTRTSTDRSRITRRRKCLTDALHVFLTDERTRTMSIDNLWVRRSTDKRLGSRFSTSRLARDIQRETLGTIDSELVRQVAVDVTATIGEKLELIASPLLPDEQVEFSTDTSAASINDVDILVEVEHRLHDAKTRVAHVIYSLGVRGQINLAHRQVGFEGFQHAGDFLRWLYADNNYPRRSGEVPPQIPRPEEIWWAPIDLRKPAIVVKKNGERREFQFEQFRKSIATAMRGRPRWNVDSEQIALWVITQMQGQRQVSSAQLSTGVSSALRRVDDIAYLRWVTISKQISNVSYIADEAEDLLRFPAVGLRFDPQGTPRQDRAMTQS